MGKLQGKVAVVTGGNVGMGLATARLFVQEGATVVITGRRQDALDAAVASIGSGAEALRSDIDVLADIDRLHDHVRDRHGRLDVLFANAGMGIFEPFGEFREESFDKVVSTVLKGTFFTAQKLLPLMKDGSSIILNTSIAGFKAFPGMSVYAGCKAALRSLARTLSLELKERGIRVNALAPGAFQTPGFEAAVGADNLASFVGTLSEQTPLGRLGETGEIASSVLYLASSDSSYVTGIELTVDGGFSQV